MHLIKIAPNKIKLISIINLILTILMIYQFSVVKIQYLLFLIVAYLIFFLLNITWFIHDGKVFKKKVLLVKHSFSKRLFNLLSHFLLPIIEVLSFWALIFFVKIPLISYILGILQSYVFLLLAINIRAYFRNTQTIEFRTHYIYEIITLVTSFMFFFALFEAKQYWGLHQIIIFIAGLIYLLVFLLVENIRYDKVVNLNFQLGFLVLFIVLQLLAFVAVLSPLRTVVFTTLLTYLYLSLLQSTENTIQTNNLVYWEYLTLSAITIVIVLEVIV